MPSRRSTPAILPDNHLSGSIRRLWIAPCRTESLVGLPLDLRLDLRLDLQFRWISLYGAYQFFIWIIRR